MLPALKPMVLRDIATSYGGCGETAGRCKIAGGAHPSDLRHSNLNTTMNVYVKSVDADSVKAMKALELVIVRLNVRRKTNPEKQNADKGVETEVSGGDAWTGTSDLRPSGRD